MRKVSEELVRKVLLNSGLEPEDKGDYYKFICPGCGFKEAFNYKQSPMLVCSRKNKCNYKEDVFNFIKTEGIYKKDILKEIGKEISEEPLNETSKEVELELPEGITFFYEDKNGLIYNRALKYIKGRAIPENNIYKLGYVYDINGRYGFSIFIPFYEDNKLVYFITRSIEGGPRYNNPKEIKGSNFVYNYDEIKEGGNVFIFEGVFNALSLDNQVGTAMLTSSLSKVQASKILDKAPKNIIFVPDNDEAGRTTLSKNISLLKKYTPPSLDINIYVYYLPEENDFNDLAKKTGKHHIYLNECEKYKHNFPGFTIKRNTFI